MGLHQVGQNEQVSVEHSRDKVQSIHLVMSKTEKVKQIIKTKEIYATNVDAILGFQSVDAHLTPSEAAEVWATLQQKAGDLGIPRIGSPTATTVSFNGGGNRALKWYDDFFAACKTCKIDFLVVQMYNQDVKMAEDILTELHKRYQLPIWVKEFNNGGRWANGEEGVPVAQHVRYMEELVDWMERQPFIERYAWQSARNSKYPAATLIQPDTTPPRLTELGKKYRELPMNVGK